jgi:hypothetical protein
MSANIDDGGAAFPDELMFGMSLRDYFAAKAMQGWLSTYADTTHPTQSASELKVFAKMAYKVADAMIAERAEGTEDE